MTAIKSGCLQYSCGSTISKVMVETERLIKWDVAQVAKVSSTDVTWLVLMELYFKLIEGEVPLLSKVCLTDATWLVLR